MDELQAGSVVEGRGGKKYVYMGGDRKSKDSYKEYTPEAAAKPQQENQALEFAASVVGGTNNAAANALKFNPMYHVAQRGSKAMQNMSDLIEQGAYSVGGKVTDATGSPEAGVVANFATQAIPSILSGSVVKHAADSVLKPAGKWFMQKAVRPSKESLMSGDAAKAVETFLSEGKNVTTGGVKSMIGEVQHLSGKVDDAVNTAQAAGTTVKKQELLSAMEEEIKRLGGAIGNDDAVAQAKKVLKKIMADPRLKDVDEIPIRLAQDIKTATYKSLGERAYNQADNMTTARISTTKAGVRGLKKGIEKGAPDVVAPNKRMSELLNAVEVAEPSILMSGNKQFLGLSGLAENITAGSAMLLDRNAYINSILGRLLHNAAPSILRDTTRLGVGAGMAMTANE